MCFRHCWDFVSLRESRQVIPRSDVVAIGWSFRLPIGDSAHSAESVRRSIEEFRDLLLRSIQQMPWEHNRLLTHRVDRLAANAFS